MQKKILSAVKESYKESIESYGIYPLLYLLKEYEDKQDFNRCAIIFESITEFIENVKGKNKNIAQDLKIPTHIDQVTTKLINQLELYKSDKFVNATKYTKEIKKTIEKVQNGL